MNTFYGVSDSGVWLDRLCLTTELFIFFKPVFIQGRFAEHDPPLPIKPLILIVTHSGTMEMQLQFSSGDN